jgi:hypothetical protein
MMQKKILLGIVAPMVFAASGHAAMAQLGSTTSAPPPDDNRPNRSAQPAAPAAATTPADVLRAAACVTNAGPAITRAIVDAAPKSPEERRAAVAFLREGERCLHMTTSLVTSLAIIRGAAAESLLEAQFATPIAARTPPVGAKPMTRPPPARPASPATPAPPGAAPAAPPPDPEVPYSLSECVAPARQDLVRALLATTPQSPEEAAGMNGLNPAYGACLAAGTQLRVDTRGFRSLLAEALYRWSVVQRDGPDSPWAAPPAPAAPATTPTPATTPAATPGH